MKFTLISFLLTVHAARYVINYRLGGNVINYILRYAINKITLIPVNESNFISNTWQQNAWLVWAVFLFYHTDSLAHFNGMPVFLEGTGCLVTVYFVFILLWITVQVCDTIAASTCCNTCLMYGIDIKRSQWAWEKVNHCLRNEVKRITPMWRRNWGKRGEW